MTFTSEITKMDHRQKLICLHCSFMEDLGGVDVPYVKYKHGTGPDGYNKYNQNIEDYE